MAKDKLPMWNDKSITHQDHAKDLDRESAILEYGHKMPRADAEKHAHDGYVKKKREQAAAHHLRGAKAAIAAGDKESAKKHSMMYELHAKALGHDSVGPVHPDITNAKTKSPYKYRPHESDIYALNEPQGNTEDKPKEAPKESTPNPHGNTDDQKVIKSEALYTIYQACELLSKTLK